MLLECLESPSPPLCVAHSVSALLCFAEANALLNKNAASVAGAVGAGRRGEQGACVLPLVLSSSVGRREDATDQDRQGLVGCAISRC